MKNKIQIEFAIYGIEYIYYFHLFLLSSYFRVFSKIDQEMKNVYMTIMVVEFARNPSGS